MSVKISFDYSGSLVGASQRQINNAMRAGYQALGEYFFQRNLPWRFSYYGQKLLQYKPRTAKYNRRKRKQKGHVNPLEFSGETKSRVLSTLTTIKAIATSTRSHVALTLNAPTLNFRANANSPDMRTEITRIATREVPPLEKVLHQDLENEFQKLEKAA